MSAGFSDEPGRTFEFVDDQVMTRLLGELPDAVVVIDSDCVVQWANKATERLFARSLDDALGVSGLDLVHPEDLELVLRSLVSVQDKEVGIPIEVRVNTAAGWRLVELLGTPIPWLADGAVLLCLRDLTERRRFELASSEEARFRSLVQNSASVTMLVSAAGVIESVSGALTRLLGHDPELVERRPLADIVDEPGRRSLADALDQATRGASAANPVTVALHLLRHTGNEAVPFELTIVNLLDDPTVGGFIISAHDITARSAAELGLRNALSLLTATLDATADGILVVDTEGQITSSNRRFIEMWRLPDSLLATGDEAATVAFVLDQLTRPEVFLTKLEELTSQPEAESHDTLLFKDGRVFERHSMPQRVDGTVVGRVWSFRDITDRTRLEDELSYQAFHDSLTGLANKALFQDRLQHATARMERAGGHLAVLFLDLDNFKTINDSLGHAAGDEMLGRVAEVLVGCLRRVDTAARLGGDEFAVLVEDIENEDDAIRLAERILAAIRRPVIVGTKEVSATASIGITFDVPGITSDQLLRNADLAMYTAKERGKNRFEKFENEMHTTVMARLEVEADLQRALVSGELIVHYQPIVDLEADVIVGFEALARWRHPTRGLLNPISFIPFAEETDLINRIDSLVLAAACAQARAWQLEYRYGPHLAISVNVSSRRLIDVTLADDVALALEDVGLPPSSLILEITESAMMRDTEVAARNLGTLKRLGVRIALDDFGTGYSSLSYLERLPIDIIKVDKSFVCTIDQSQSDVGLAPAIVQLAHTLGHMTIAEGIEKQVQVELLRQMGCQLGQGYHLGMPQDAKSTGALLQARRVLPRPPDETVGGRHPLTDADVSLPVSTSFPS
jgi:diguanylate cyclase (GGDEF)-like protein/PAS domain S-box-containing protein